MYYLNFCKIQTVDEVGVDEMGVDQMGVDEMGSTRSGNKPIDSPRTFICRFLEIEKLTKFSLWDSFFFWKPPVELPNF